MIRRGKDKGSTGVTGKQSWRALSKVASARKFPINTPQARRRRLQKIFKICGLSLLPALIFSGGLFAVSVLKKQGKEIEITPPSRPIERILFHTNGVLPDRWLSSVFDLKSGMTLMEADIYGIKSKLEAEGQVKTASVERVFPNILRINVTEHVPMLRMIVVGSSGNRELRIVSNEGIIYSGKGYGKTTLLQMPFLRPYQHANGRFEPLLGLSHLATLLETCRQHHPNEFSQWQLISLENYTGNLKMPGEVVKVTAINRRQGNTSPKKTRIIFSALTDFAVQLDRLRHIREVTKSIGDTLLNVDLSLRNSAAVQFESGRTSLY